MEEAGTSKTRLSWPDDYVDKIVQGNNIDILRGMPEESVHCVVTSPPYWGLRDYDTPPQVWGGDPDCQHKWGDRIRRKGGAGNQGESSQRKGRKNVDDQKKVRDSGAHCACGAWKGNLGLEPTPGLFIDNMVRVFREVWRVLRKDGTLWLNMGDTYFTSGGHADKDCADRRGQYRIGCRPMSEYRMHRKTKDMGAGMGLKNKDLILMPARIAIALQEDGWYVRIDNIWNKPSPMPESVTDRTTRAHEYIFQLAKSQKYFYDADAIKEKSVGPSNERPFGKDGNKDRNDQGRTFEFLSMRNKRSVWTVTSVPYSEAHFATFPPKLITPCILAGCPKGGIVLDPFGGAGTTALVAAQYGRRSVSIELNPDYCAIAEKRIASEQSQAKFL